MKAQIHVDGEAVRLNREHPDGVQTPPILLCMPNGQTTRAWKVSGKDWSLIAAPHPDLENSRGAAVWLEVDENSMVVVTETPPKTEVIFFRHKGLRFAVTPVGDNQWRFECPQCGQEAIIGSKKQIVAADANQQMTVSTPVEHSCGWHALINHGETG